MKNKIIITILIPLLLSACNEVEPKNRFPGLEFINKFDRTTQLVRYAGPGEHIDKCEATLADFATFAGEHGVASAVEAPCRVEKVNDETYTMGDMGLAVNDAVLWGYKLPDPMSGPFDDEDSLSSCKYNFKRFVDALEAAGIEILRIEPCSLDKTFPDHQKIWSGFASYWNPKYPKR